jgi:hypothetical protein
LNAQNEAGSPKFSPPEHLFRDVCLSVSPNLLINTPNTMQFAGGLKLSLFMGKHISFDTDIVFGRDYFHAGPGIIGIPVWLLVVRPSDNDIEFESFSQLAFIIVAMALSAEHTAFHLPVSKSFEVAPYLSMLRYRSAYEYGHYSNTNMVNEQLSFAVGVELNKYIRKFVLSPYVECGAGYRDHKAQINAGVYCGFYIFTKTIN